MKERTLIVWACLLLGATAAASGAPASEAPVVVCAFEPPRVDAAANGCARVSVPDCQSLRRVGEPILPFRTVRLLLPPGAAVVRLEALPQAIPETLDGFFLVEAAPPPASHWSAPFPPHGNKPIAQVDSAIYSSAEPYPAARAELASVQRMAGYDIAVIRVFPVQYLPALGQLEFLARITVALELDVPRTAVAASAVPFQLRGAWDRVAAFVDNPGMLAAYIDDGARTLAPGQPQVDYLLLTRQALAPSFQPLLDHKAQDGLSVRLETVESIAALQPGRDLPEQIRNYIRDAYASWGIRYVLLGGDTSTVPCRYAYAYVNEPDIVSLIPCDLYYACLDGSWNRDGDNRWGEPTDGDSGGDVDLLAEVYVGRAPVDTTAEVDTFVEKTLRFEAQSRNPALAALFISEFLGDTSTGPAQGGRMFDPLVPFFAGYQLTWLDDRPFTTPQWTRADAIGAMNLSPDLVLLNGHGESDVLIGASGFVRSIEIYDLDALTNERPFLAYSVGCDVGQYDNDRFSPDCIGEAIVTRHSRGAMAAVFNSRVGWYLPQEEEKYSGEFQKEFFEILLTSRSARLGAANQLAKHQMLAHVEASGIMTYRFCYYEITLFGDPHLAWTPPDTDGDSMPDAAEGVAGTDPADASSALRIRLLPASDSGGGVRLEWPSAPGRIYTVFRADDLASGAFASVADGLPATPPWNSYEDDVAGWEFGFYRVEVKLAP